VKERVALTIDSSLLEIVDSTVDGNIVKNRSRAIEFLLRKAIGANVPKQALILAGGEGKRLRPLTHEMPKPMIPLQGKPIMEHTVDLLLKFDIRTIVISIGYKGEMVKEKFGDGSRFGAKFFYVEEKQPLGTGGPLTLAMEHIDGPFVMCNADELKNIDLADMYRVHQENQALCTIALTTVADPSAYGVVKMQGSRITEFIEKPDRSAAPSKLINAGLYIVEPEVMQMAGPGPCSIEKEIFPKLAAMGKLMGYPFSGQWFDTGTPDRYERAMKEWNGL